MTFIEELFTSVGDRFEGDFIEKIIENYNESQKELKDAGSNKSEEKKKSDQKKDSDSGIKKEHFKSFVEALEKENYQKAVIELLELGAKKTQLDKNDYYFALLTFCFVALKKYGLADYADKLARQYNPAWEKNFDDLADDVYDSGLLLTAEFLSKDVRELDLEAKMEELEWEKEDVQLLIDELYKIFRLENEKIAKTLEAEKISSPLDTHSTLDDVIITLCDELILPFYVRLELQNIVKRFND